jgi:plastocyanin
MSVTPTTRRQADQPSPIVMPSSSTHRAIQRGSYRARLGILCNPLALVMMILLGAPAFAATKQVQVGPNGFLVFADGETGTNTTTITAGDTVEWVWASSGHSTTRIGTPKTWDSGVQQGPFTFSVTFPDPGTFDYFCIPHQSLGMTGTIMVKPAGSATTTTLVSSATTSTTIPLPPNVAQAFASIGQGLQTLRDQVTAAPIPDPSKTVLSHAVRNAERRLAQAQTALMRGHRGNGKQSLQAAARFIRRFEARLRSVSGHQRIAPNISDMFVMAAEPIRMNLQALRNAV